MARRFMDLQMFSDDLPVEEPESAEEPEGELSREDVLRHSTFLKRATHLEPAAKSEEADNPAGEPAVADPPKEEVSKEEASLAEKKEEGPVKFKLSDTEEATLEEIQEWRKGHMMQADYTKKTQVLADERRQFDQERTKFDPSLVEQAVNLWRQMEVDPIGSLDKLREYYETQGIYEPKDEATLKLEMERRDLEAEKQKLEQEKQQRLQQEAYNSIDAQLTKAAETYGEDFDRAKMIQFMIDNKTVDVDYAAKALNHDAITGRLQKQIDELNKKIGTVKTEAVNEYVKTKTTKSASPPPVGASTTGAPPVQLNVPKTFEDSKKAALARLQNMSTG